MLQVPKQHCRQHAGPRRPECPTSDAPTPAKPLRASRRPRSRTSCRTSCWASSPNGRRPQQPARTGAGVRLGRALDSVRPCAVWATAIAAPSRESAAWAGRPLRVKADTSVTSQHTAIPFGAAPYTTRSRRRRSGARVAAASAGMAESHAPACGPDWDRKKVVSA